MSRVPSEWKRQFRHGLNRLIGAASGDSARFAALERAMEWTRLGPDEVRERQLLQLRKVLVHAQATVPYWREVFEDCRFDPAALRDTSELSRLPVLTKTIIREQGERMLSSVFPRRILRERRTGGSTGEPLRFYVTREEFEEQMGIALRSQALVGIRPGDAMAKFWGYRSPNRFGNLIAPLTGRVYLDAYATDENDLNRYLRLLRRTPPRLIYGYTQAIHELAKHAERIGADIPGLAIIATTAEKLHPEQRLRMESVFGAKVIDMYGAHEAPRLASECLAGRMHLAPDSAVMEFDPLPDTDDADSCRVLMTSLTGFAMPLIRYDIGDQARPAPGGCECGLPFACMSMDVGKAHHMFALPSGRRLFSGYFYKPVYGIDAIARFQICHAERDLIRIAYVPVAAREVEAKAELERVIEPMRAELAGEAAIVIEAVADIPRTPSGKQPAVVSLVSSDGSM